MTCLRAFTQGNLVPNPGFEERISCPAHLSDFTGIVKYWFTPTSGTPNFYHSCASQPEVGVPDNYFGHKTAQEGQAYAGIMTSNAYREYISVQLTTPLAAGKMYKLSFYTSIISKSNCNSQGLDALFTPHRPTAEQANDNLNARASLNLTVQYSGDQWIKTEACYRANGGERYLTLGDLTFPQARHNCADGEISYYFIDDVRLEPTEFREEEVNFSTCRQPFPLQLDGAEISRTALPAEKINWNWDGSFNGRFRTIEKKGIYRLSIELPGCHLEKYIVRVTDEDCDHAVFIPNVFTPDGDGINDFFEIKAKGIDFQKVVVYNRFGQVVFESSDPEFRWEGGHGTKPAENGVYLYLIQYAVRAGGRPGFRSGSITLIR